MNPIGRSISVAGLQDNISSWKTSGSLGFFVMDLPVLSV
jgi:hypothetical protein